ncbi:hypothetical protein [Microbacterium sp. Clip185]|uniref:hypothetical protein n=1 Tax=Microbacterium sp. Clip185 TaxID=3025663 RepID=UPI0023664E55|nr:hypothetical protein [Microbacterium sp. Clip185]WDG17617.1 hypothetical protein PQV94_13460 [Microbacterium sp. Clip185]
MDRATQIAVTALGLLALVAACVGVFAAGALPGLELHAQRAASLVPFVVATLAVLSALALTVSRRRLHR